MSMITASLWVGRGIPAAFPARYDVDEDEAARITKLAKLRLDDAKADLAAFEEGKDDEDDEDDEMHSSEVEEDTEGQAAVKAAPPKVNGADDDLAEYDLDNYDDDSEVADAEDSEKKGTLSLFGNTRSLAFYESNTEDPNLTQQPGEDEDEDEREELQILPTDNMVVAAKVEDEVPSLEIYVYEDEADNLYVHHDIMLPAIPLCLEWLDLPVKHGTDASVSAARGNFVAVGTMEPDIELWDLDVVDALYPNAILGAGSAEPAEQANDRKPTQKKKKKKHKAQSEEYHTDAVLSLAANRQHRNLLASASADKTVKLWDLTNTAKCAKSYSQLHSDKICSVAWNTPEPTWLLSGSYDATAVVSDMREENQSASALPRWRVPSDVENVMWDPHRPEHFYVSTDQGMLYVFDVRSPPSGKTEPGAGALWTLHAHDKALSSMDVHATIPGFLATGSSDKTVKLWSLPSHQGQQQTSTANSRKQQTNGSSGANGPSLLVSRNFGMGEIFTTHFAPDAEVGFRLAVAGSEGALQVWDTSTNSSVRKAFAGRHSANIASAPANAAEEDKDRVVGVEQDADSSDDENDEDEPNGVALEDGDEEA